MAKKATKQSKAKSLSPEIQKADELRRKALAAASVATCIAKQSKNEFDNAKTKEDKDAVRQKYSSIRKQSKFDSDKAFSEYDNYILETFGIRSAYSETNEKFFSTDEGFIDYLDKLSRKKDKTAKKPAKDKPAKAAAPAPKSAPTFTVMAGRKSKTFATKAEAKEYEKQCREKTGKKYAIQESKKKPSHRVVSFTAKNK